MDLLRLLLDDHARVFQRADDIFDQQPPFIFYKIQTPLVVVTCTRVSWAKLRNQRLIFVVPLYYTLWRSSSATVQYASEIWRCFLPPELIIALLSYDRFWRRVLDELADTSAEEGGMTTFRRAVGYREHAGLLTFEREIRVLHCWSIKMECVSLPFL